MLKPVPFLISHCFFAVFILFNFKVRGLLITPMLFLSLMNYLRVLEVPCSNVIDNTSIFIALFHCVVQGWRKCLFPRKVVEFSTIFPVYACTKKGNFLSNCQNFPSNAQISREGASQLPNFFHPWCGC